MIGRIGGFTGSRFFLLMLLVLSSLFAQTARSHEILPSLAVVDVGEGQVTIKMELVLEPLITGMDLTGLRDTDDSPMAADHDALRGQEPHTLRRAFDAAWPDIQAGFTLLAGDARLSADVVEVGIPEVGNVALARPSTLTLQAKLPEGETAVQFGWDRAYGDLIVRAGDPIEGYAALLPPGQVSPPLTGDGVQAQSAWVSFLNYIFVGFDHIIPKGLDHILFVLGLFFFSTALAPLLWQVTAFTLAHTITLALATLQIVSVPASVVEPLIALSIVYVAVENIIGGEHTGRRVMLVFGFGLLHGLGFASVLGEFGLASQFVASLLGFNIGVELGQLAVIAIAFAAVGIWFSQKPWYRTAIAVPASVLIGAVGLYWSVERVFF